MERLGNGQVNLLRSLRTTTYKLTMDTDWEIVRSTWQDHWEPSHTPWRCTEIGKWSCQFDTGIIDKYHIHPEDQTELGNGQVNLKGSLRTSTYTLRMDRDGKIMVRLTGSLRTMTYSLRTPHRDWEMVKSTWKNHWESSHTSTCWGWTEIVKWSGQPNRIIENHHILSEDRQRLGNVKLTWNDHWNHHILPEDGQRLGKNMTASLIMTYFLRMDRDRLGQFHSNISHSASYHLLITV